MYILRLVTLLMSVLLMATSAHAQLGNITNSMTFLGNPHLVQWPDNTEGVFARNVWTMRQAGNTSAASIHLGSGTGAPNNAGPVYATKIQVRPVSPCNNGYTENCGFFLWTPPLDTEEISNIVLLDGNVFIPDIDPHTGPQNIGGYYMLNLFNSWTTKRNIPGASHTKDLISIGSPATKIFAASTTYLDQYGVLRASVQVTTDGDNWTDLTCNGVQCPQNAALKFFTLGGQIYVSMLGTAGVDTRLYQVDTAANNLLSLSTATIANMLPGTTYYVWDNTPAFSGIAYLAGRKILPGDGHFIGEKVMYAPSIGNAVEVTLPYVGAVPVSIRMIGNVDLFLLSYKKESAYIYTVYLHRAGDPLPGGGGTWTEVCRFQTLPPGGIARSFEFVSTGGLSGTGHAGNLYFGLGTLYDFIPGSPGVPGTFDRSSLSNAAGQILKIAFTP